MQSDVMCCFAKEPKSKMASTPRLLCTLHAPALGIGNGAILPPASTAIGFALFPRHARTPWLVMCNAHSHTCTGGATNPIRWMDGFRANEPR